MSKVIAYGLVGFLAVVALFAGLALGGLIVLLVWNFGMVPLVAACGGAISKIGFWTAFFANAAITIVGRMLHAPAPRTK